MTKFTIAKNVLFYQDINQSISFHFSSSIIFANNFPNLDGFRYFQKYYSELFSHFVMDIHQNYAFFTNYGCALIERLNNVIMILKSTLIIKNYECYPTFILFAKYIY